MHIDIGFHKANKASGSLAIDSQDSWYLLNCEEETKGLFLDLVLWDLAISPFFLFPQMPPEPSLAGSASTRQNKFSQEDGL